MRCTEPTINPTVGPILQLSVPASVRFCASDGVEKIARTEIRTGASFVMAVFMARFLQNRNLACLCARGRLDRGPTQSCPGLRRREASGVFLALRHEAVLGGAGERLAVLAHGLARAGVALALRHEAGLRGARERL